MSPPHETRAHTALRVEQNWAGCSGVEMAWCCHVPVIALALLALPGLVFMHANGTGWCGGVRADATATSRRGIANRQHNLRRQQHSH